ncbi:MAG: hypothetical protein LBS44_02230 [Deltaproteobacteria bacterium]|nr:hypothetical protein [Deltaproteobacteria bacterium]
MGQNGHHLWLLANGIDPRPVEPEREAKSLGNEETYAVDIQGLENVSRELLALSVKVAARLRSEKLSALTVTVKARDNKFKTVTRSKTLREPISDHAILHKLAMELFPSEKRGPWRLLGVSTSNLGPAGGSRTPTNLLEAAGLKPMAGNPGLLAAMDAINNRYGQGQLKPATLLDRPDNLSKSQKLIKPDN